MSLRQDGRHNGTGGLARPIGVERPHNHHRQAEAIEVAGGQFVRSNLAGGVGRLGDGRMFFLVDGPILGRAIRFTGADVNDAANALAASCLQNVQRSAVILVSTYSAGASSEYGTPIRAARWKITSIPSVAFIRK